MRASRPGPVAPVADAKEANRLLYPQALKEIRRVTRASGRGLVSQAEIETNKSCYVYIYTYLYIYILFVCEGMTFAWPLYMWFKGIVNINRDVKSVITMNHCGSGVFKQWQCGISPCHCDLFSQVRSHFHRLNSLCTHFCLKNSELCDLDCSPSRYLFIQTLVVSQIRGSFLAESPSKTMNFLW